LNASGVIQSLSHSLTLSIIFVVMSVVDGGSGSTTFSRIVK